MTRRAAIAACALAMCGAPPAVAGAAGYTRVAVIDDAAAQSTAEGRTLHTLHPFDGRLYVGYGDWSANTGPIWITSITPTGTIAREHLQDTEAITRYRPVGGQLYVPSIDPRGTNPGGVAIGPSPWVDRQTIGHAQHVFDVARYQAALYAVGGDDRSGGTVWRSTNGGQTWRTFAQFFGAHITAAFTLGDRLFVQPDATNLQQYTGGTSGSRSWLGITFAHGWTELDFALPYDVGNYFVHQNGTIVYLDAGGLKRFDGIHDPTPLRTPGRASALTVQGRLYIATDRGVYRSSDAGWQQLAPAAPEPVASIAVLDGTVYLGSTSSSIWRLA